jgi:hypothetical protein
VQLLDAQTVQKDKKTKQRNSFVLVQATVKKLSDTSSYAQDFVVWLN